jgi:heme/copper-type cytochrome/quinol oxidase subunit 2
MYNKINVLSEKDFNEWLATVVNSDSLAVKDSTIQVMSN